MKTITIKLYEFGELSDEVRKAIVEKKCFDVMDDVMESHNSEYEASLKAFEYATDFGARDWEVGYCNHTFKQTHGYAIGAYGYPMDAEDCKGKLLWRWCYRFVSRNLLGKYYGKLVPHEKDKEHPVGLRHVLRHSMTIMEPIEGGWCPWTGCITDCALLEPIVDFYLNYHRGKFSEDYSLEDLIGDCLEKFFDEWESEYNAYGDNKNNCVEEELNCRYDGDYFYANGKLFAGDIEELKAA